MRRRQWYRARIAWVGDGGRARDSPLGRGRVPVPQEDREAAFQRALEIGEGGQSGGEEETRRCTRWVETRLAEVTTLECLGDELDDEPLEVQWVRLPATERIAFDHKFEPAKKAPAAVG